MTALACSQVTMRYGAFSALDTISLKFEPARFYGLIGPNGAGKTTLINVLSGAAAPTAGTVRIGQHRVAATRHAFARRGVSRSFQTSSLFGELTARESLVLALQSTRRWQSPWSDPTADKRFCGTADAMLARLGMAKVSDIRVDCLAHGWQRLLDLGIAFVTDAHTVLLDEPFAGIGHAALEQTESLIRTLAVGRTVVMVEHNMSVLMRLVDEIVVLAGGKMLAIGTAEQVRANPAVRQAYLGSG